MEEAKQRIRNEINARNQQITAGVSVQDKERMEREIVAFEEELRNLDQPEQSQELPEEVTEEVKPEPILATVDTLPLETYTDYAELIRLEVGNIIEGINDAHKAVVADLKNKINLSNELELSLKQRNVELERDYQICAAENLELVQDNVKLTQDNHQITIERNEAFTIRDNALRELEATIQELKEAKAEINRNRELKIQTEAERTAAAEAERQKLKDSRVKVYNIRQEDEINSKWSVANVADTGELIRFETIYKGRYEKVDEETALNMQAMNKPVPTPPIDEVVNQEQFQSEDASGEDTQSLDATEDQGEQREVTEVEPETFEQRTERRLNALELKVNRNDIIIHDLAS